MKQLACLNQAWHWICQAKQIQIMHAVDTQKGTKGVFSALAYEEANYHWRGFKLGLVTVQKRVGHFPKNELKK